MTGEKYAQLIEILGTPILSYTDINGIHAFWEPVYDRLPEDCVYGNEKGSFDWKVLNRINANIEYITYLLYVNGYNVEKGYSDLVYTRADYLFYNTYELLRKAHNELAQTINMLELTVEPTLAGNALAYVSVNRLEQLEYATYILINNLQTILLFCQTYGSAFIGLYPKKQSRSIARDILYTEDNKQIISSAGIAFDFNALRKVTPDNVYIAYLSEQTTYQVHLEVNT